MWYFTFGTGFFECREKFCDFAFEIIVWCHSENNDPHHLKSESFLKGEPDFENTEHILTHLVLNDLMDSAYFINVSQLFTKGAHHRNISLELIAQNLFHQDPSSRDISLNSVYIYIYIYIYV